MIPRILPRKRDPVVRRPLQRLGVVVAFLFFGLFALLALFLFFSRLDSTLVTGRAINGSVSTSVNVSSSPPFLCDYTFAPGTNLVSFPCLEPLTSPQQFFVNLTSGGANVLAIYRYTPTTHGDWVVYNGSLPNYTVQSLTELNRNEGLYFVMSDTDRFSLTGILPQNTSIIIRQGWNLVGYPSNRTLPLNESLASIAAAYTLIKALDGVEEVVPYLFAYNPGGGTLNQTSIYHGYWINSTVLTYWQVSS